MTEGVATAYTPQMIHRLLLTGGVVGAAFLAVSPASASCVRMSAAEQRARADVVFVGVALDGATASGIERFRVSRYLKGTGSPIVRVRTGRRRYPSGGGVVTSVSIDAGRGETWRIYARKIRPGLFETNVCDGSRRIRPRR